MPLFPELMLLLKQGFDEAQDKTGFVISNHRQKNANLRTQFLRILGKAEITPWKRLFQNLRASRLTDLAKKNPLHAVTQWLGNTETTANKHYLQVTDWHFDQAIEDNSNAIELEKMLNSTPQDEAAKCRETHEPLKEKALASETVTDIGLTKGNEAPPRGDEQSSYSSGKPHILGEGGTENGTVGDEMMNLAPDVRWIIEAWRYLPTSSKEEIIAVIRQALPFMPDVPQ